MNLIVLRKEWVKMSLPLINTWTHFVMRRPETEIFNFDYQLSFFLYTIWLIFEGAIYICDMYKMAVVLLHFQSDGGLDFDWDTVTFRFLVVNHSKPSLVTVFGRMLRFVILLKSDPLPLPQISCRLKVFFWTALIMASSILPSRLTSFSVSTDEKPSTQHDAICTMLHLWGLGLGVMSSIRFQLSVAFC